MSANQDRYIDLTHSLVPNIPNWDGGCGFEKHILFDYDPSTPSGETTFLVQELKMAAGIGTHVDAPSHCCPGRASVADIPLSDLICPCAVVDVSLRVVDHSYIVSKEDVHLFEEQYGYIKKGYFVIFRTGWDREWP